MDISEIKWPAKRRRGRRRREEQSEPAVLTHKPEFVRLASEVRDMTAVHAKIELVLERGEYRVLASGSQRFSRKANGPAVKDFLSF